MATEYVFDGDTQYVQTFNDLHKSIEEIKGVLDTLLPMRVHYDKLSVEEQIELDLFLSYTLTSLQWVHLRVQGIDPNDHQVKGELERIQAAMKKWQEVKDRDKRPKVNIDAAKRFIRSGLYDPFKDTGGQPPNKKTKFDDDD